MPNPKTVLAIVPEKKRTAEWQATNDKIIEKITEMIEATGEMPTQQAVANALGIHYNSVNDHLKQMNIQKHVLPRYKMYAVEIIKRHLELMRQNDDKAVALKAVITLEEKLLGLIPQAQLNVKEDTPQKKLIIEIEDRRNNLLKEVNTAVEIPYEQVDEDKSST